MGNGAVFRLLVLAAALLALSLPAQAGATTPPSPPTLPAKAAILTVLLLPPDPVPADPVPPDPVPGGPAT